MIQNNSPRIRFVQAFFTVIVFLSVHTPVAFAALGGDYWVTKASMPTARSIGILHSPVVNNIIYAIGGFYYDVNVGNSFPSYANESYDPVTNSWAIKASTPTIVSDSAAAAVGSNIYIIGGTNGFSNYNEVYNTITDSWSAIASIPGVGVSAAAAAAVGNNIYLFGGYNGDTNTNVYTNNGSSYVYNTITNSWSSIASMPTPRLMSSAIVIGSNIYVVGGYTGGGFFSPKSFVNEIYNTVTGVWSSGASFPNTYSTVYAGAHGKIYSIFGDTIFGTPETIKQYDPTTNIWTALASYEATAAFSTVAASLDNLYLIGGTACSFCYPTLSTNKEYVTPVSVSVYFL